MNLSLQSLVTWEGDVLVCVQKGEKENRGWRQWVKDDKLYVVSLRVCPVSFPCARTNFPFTLPCALISKMALHSSSELKPNACGHIVKRPFTSGSGDFRQKSVWLFLWMAPIKMKVQNAELGSQDLRRNAGNLKKTSWGEM